jgi:hypothetical protein
VRQSAISTPRHLINAAVRQSAILVSAPHHLISTSVRQSAISAPRHLISAATRQEQYPTFLN